MAIERILLSLLIVAGIAGASFAFYCGWTAWTDASDPFDRCQRMASQHSGIQDLTKLPDDCFIELTGRKPGTNIP